MAKSNKFYALKSPTGKVAFLNLAVNGNLERALAKFAVLNFTPVEVVEVTKADIPADREFRNAFIMDSTKKITYDLEKAKRIKQQKLREEREDEFARLDIEVNKELAKGNQTRASELETERQRLRDVTKHSSVLGATSVGALRSLTLAQLLQSE